MTRKARRQRGFSLVETLVVVGIVAILLGLVTMAVTGPLRAQGLSSSAGIFAAEVAAARGEAIRSNRTVEVQLLRDADPGGAITGYQAFFVQDDASLREVAPPQTFPRNVVVSEAPDLTRLPGSTSTPDHITFRFKPDGSTSLDLGAQSFLTLVPAKDAAATTPPEDFATVQIEPFTGAVRVLRP